MQIIDFKELISFIENSPEKSIPKSILITEISKMKKDAENHVHKAEKRIYISLFATALFVFSKILLITYYYFQKDIPVLFNLNLLDICIPSLLCIGLYYKNKSASLGLLIYYLISTYIHLDIQGINILRFIFIFIYSYIYIQGYFASISYQKHKILGN